MVKVLTKPPTLVILHNHIAVVNIVEFVFTLITSVTYFMSVLSTLH